MSHIQASETRLIVFLSQRSKVARILLTCVVSICALCLTSVSVAAQSGWRMDGYNSQRTNRTPNVGSTTLPNFRVLTSSPEILQRISDDGSLILRDATTVSSYSSSGALKWRRTLGAGVSPISDVAISPSGTVYVSISYTASVTALDKDTGRDVWSSPFVANDANPGNESGPLTIGSDGTIYFVTGTGIVGTSTINKMTAVNPNGTQKWEVRSIFNRGHHRPVLNSDESIVYVLSGGVKGVSTATGNLVVNSYVNCDPRGSVLAFAPWNVFYTGDVSNNLLEFPPAATSCRFIPTGDWVNSLVSFTNTGNIVIQLYYGQGSRGHLAVIDRNGRRLWTTTERFSKAFLDGAGTIYATAKAEGDAEASQHQSDLVAISSETGEVLWRKQFDQPIFSFFLGGNGKLYVSTGHTQGDKLYESTAAPQRTPLIFIPGIGGSKLVGDRGQNFWLGSPCYDELTLDPSRTQRNVTAIEAIRRITVPPLPPYEVYGPLLDELARSGYSETGSRPTLFVFPYDWRRANEDHVQGLAGMIAQIRAMYPNTQVNILAHSMGGLVARRYILERPTDHHVQKLITVASPWLGAPKAINTLETGQFLMPLGFGVNFCTGSIKTLAEFFPGMHQLLPSRAYVNDFGGTPFREDGWDIDGDGNAREVYDYNNLVAMLDGRYRSSPGITGFRFHNREGQDDWRNRGFSVQYYHLFGMKRGADTIGQIVSRRKAGCRRTPSGDVTCIPSTYIDVTPIDGDGTVPLLSARRTGGQNFNYEPNTRLYPFVAATRDDNSNVEHLGIVKNPNVWGRILSILHNGQQAEREALEFANETVEPEAQPSYYLRILGAPSVTVMDAAGNSTSPFSTTLDAGLPTVTPYLLGEKSLLVILQTDRTHTVTLRSDADPLEIELTKGTDVTTTEAVRYQDLSLPAGVTAMLRVTPQGVEVLRYDRDGDGTFETTVTPTASVSGSTAQDTESPVVSVSEARQQAGTLVTLTATDGGSGVRTVYYSLDGTNYQPYTNPFSVNPFRTPTIYAFADDNVANRSSLVTHQVTQPGVETEVRVWTVGDRTEAYVKLALPHDGYRVTNWGQIVRTGNEFSVTATLAVDQIGSATLLPTATARIYNLGALTPGAYTFTFRSNMTGNTPPVAFTGARSNVPNPIDDARTYAREHYRDFLSRDPDAPGLDFWTNQITRCGADSQCIDRQRVGVSASFFLSQEFQATGYYVYRLYKGALNRAPFYVEFVPDVARVAAGIVVDNRLSPEVIDANKRAFAVAFVGRDDFRRRYPETMPNAEFVDALFTLTGSTASAGERAALTAELNSNVGTIAERRASVLYKIVDGTRSVRSETNPVDVVQIYETSYGRAFYVREYNPAFVRMQYFGYLKRDPDEGGYQFWLDKLNFFGNYVDAEMVRSFILAAEYRARFGQP